MIGDDWRGGSETIGTFLLVGITMLLAILVLLLFHMPSMTWDGRVQPVIQISGIYHQSEISPFQMNFDSRIVLVHNGTTSFENRLLKAKIYKNDVLLPATLTTLNGHDFISTTHYGVQWIGGSGCSGSTWAYGERLVIDLSDGTLHPNDRVRVEILSSPLNSLISRDIAVA
jgi:hypothetical protein